MLHCYVCCKLCCLPVGPGPTHERDEIITQSGRAMLGKKPNSPGYLGVTISEAVGVHYDQGYSSCHIVILAVTLLLSCQYCGKNGKCARDLTQSGRAALRA